MGNTVNLAARIEAHTKDVDCPILVDENMRTGLLESVRVEGLGPVLFKGTQQSVNIFSVTI